MGDDVPNETSFEWLYPVAQAYEQLRVLRKRAKKYRLQVTSLKVKCRSLYQENEALKRTVEKMAANARDCQDLDTSRQVFQSARERKLEDMNERENHTDTKKEDTD